MNESQCNKKKKGDLLFRNLPPDPLAREERDHKLVLALVRLEPERLVNNLASFSSSGSRPPNRDLVPLLRRVPIKLPPEPTAEPFQPLERDLGPFKQLGREGDQVRRSVDPRRTGRRERHFVDGRPIGSLHLRDLQRRQLGRGGVRGRVGPEEELGVPVPDGGAEGGAVRREFRERLAEAERGRAGAVDGQREVVRRNGRDDVRRQGLDLCEGVRLESANRQAGGEWRGEGKRQRGKLTASTAAAVVQCSSTIRSLGNLRLISRRCGKNRSSAFKTQVPWLRVLAVGVSMRSRGRGEQLLARVGSSSHPRRRHSGLLRAS